MCGIAGVWRRKTEPEAALLAAGRAMADRLHHRGPDGGDTWADPKSGLVLAHRRLSILDVTEAASQPMSSPSGRYEIVFNGEIYNHLALRAEIEAVTPMAWQSTGDTATLLAAIDLWGLQTTLEKARGMFAIALWDRAENRLTLARDRFGEKPLYYGFLGNSGRKDFYFTSELDALRPVAAAHLRVNAQALPHYFARLCAPAPLSFIEGIAKAMPGEILSLDPSGLARGEVTRSRYWQLPEVARAARAENATLDDFEATLQDAVSLQMISDVPIGAFLSGGIDSSTIVALMQRVSGRPVKTYTVGFEDEGYDEAPFAQAVADHLGTEHHTLYCGWKDVEALIPRLPEIYSEPFADSSQIPTWLVCRAARTDLTVALTGDGGDELLGGYNHYAHTARLWRIAQALPRPLRRVLAAGFDARRAAAPRDRAGKAVALVRRNLAASRSGDLIAFFATKQSHAVSGGLMNDSPLPPSVAEADLAGFEPFEQMMLADALHYMTDDILVKVDRAAMSVSLETRIPLMDPDVVAAAWRLGDARNLGHPDGKFALREVLARHVPRSLFERPKKGFGLPIGAWLRGPLRDWAEALFESPVLEDTPGLDARHLRKLWEGHKAGLGRHSSLLWAVLMYVAWHERFFGADI
jgi:asparagine synthase (glutamine-hydrolysing)